MSPTSVFTYGTHYLNLGYLPGGALGVAQFASDPNYAASEWLALPLFGYDYRGLFPATQPPTYTLAALLQPVTPTQTLSSPGVTLWNTPVLSGVLSLKDFGLVVVIAASADSARVWIEQSQVYAKDLPLVAAVSAGADPLARPYYTSKQLKGLVNGIIGGAQYEDLVGVQPKTFDRWDTLGWGMFTAAALIVIGNAFYGFRALWRLRKPRKKK
jgi:hypothetical protein